MEDKELNIQNKEIDLSMIEDALSPDVSEEDAAQFQLMGDKVY